MTCAVSLAREVLAPDKEPGEAQALHAKRAAEIAEKWARLRGNAPLDHVDLFGLAGEMYRDMLAKNQRNPGGPGKWHAEIEKYTRDRLSPLTGFYNVVRQNRDFRYGAEARKFLADRAYILDEAQFSTFLVAFVDAAKLGAEQLLKNSLGDYASDKEAQEKYPKFEPRKVGPELDPLGDLGEILAASKAGDPKALAVSYARGRKALWPRPRQSEFRRVGFPGGMR
jgi:hypothetical protein